MKRIKEDSRLKEIITLYDTTKEKSLFNDLVDVEEKIDNPEIIIPILGLQGVGKSTVINAYLGEDIMPTETDETTCIPVEVRYGLSKAEVHFKDNTIKTIENEKEVLAQYVDNEYNPANKKGVSRIVVSDEFDVLKNGIVIVDLPGVGSLTKENEMTTTEYIKKLCAAVFVIPTVPTITQVQASFIKNVWRGVSTAFFIQNIWDDNTEEEIEEGLSYNRNIINRIAREIGVKVKNDIMAVNVYNAAKGAFTSNQELIDSSNINSMKENLDEFALNFINVINEDFKSRIKATADLIKDEIHKRIEQSSMSKEDLLNQLKNERESFKEATKKIDKCIDGINSSIDNYKKNAKEFADNLVNDKVERLRKDMEIIINNGVVDGKILSEAFSDNQSKYGTEMLDEAYDKLFEISQEIMNEIEELDVIFEKENINLIGVEEFYKEQSLKWEKGVDVGIKLAGAVGGAAVAAAVTGAMSGTASAVLIGATSGAWAGPVGIAAGIAVALACSLIGSGVKKVTQGSRAKQTLSEIQKPINDFKIKMKDSLNDYFKSYFNEVARKIEDFQESEQDHLNYMNERIKNIINKGNDIDSSIDEMSGDLVYLEGVEF